ASLAEPHVRIGASRVERLADEGPGRLEGGRDRRTRSAAAHAIAHELERESGVREPSAVERDDDVLGAAAAAREEELPGVRAGEDERLARTETAQDRVDRGLFGRGCRVAVGAPHERHEPDEREDARLRYPGHTPTVGTSS